MDTLLVKEQKGLVAAFASLLNTPMDNEGRINVPAQFGHGYLQAFDFNPGLRMMVRDYQLIENLPVSKNTPNCFTESVILLFQNIALENTGNHTFLPSVQVFP